MKILRFGDRDEADFRRVCYHEAGHKLVATHYGLAGEAFIGAPGAGICEMSPGTPVQNAAIGWAGPLAEVISGMPDPARTWPEIPLTNARAFDWYEAFLRDGHLNQVTANDRELLAGDSNSFGSFQRAFDILTSKREILDYLAERLVEDYRDTVFAALNDRDGGEGRINAWVKKRKDLGRALLGRSINNKA